MLLHQLELLFVLKYIEVSEDRHHWNVAEVEVVEECFLGGLYVPVTCQGDAVPEKSSSPLINSNWVGLINLTKYNAASRQG